MRLVALLPGWRRPATLRTEPSLIEAEPARLLVRPVALDAVLLQQRLDVAPEVHLRRDLRGGERRRAARPGQQAGGAERERASRVAEASERLG